MSDFTQYIAFLYIFIYIYLVAFGGDTMIAFRFHRGGFEESMETLQIFKSTKDMFIFLSRKYQMSFSNFRIEPYFMSEDSRCKWDFTNIVMYKSKNNNWCPLGWCCDSFHLVD